MAGNTLSFAELIPERDRFEVEKGEYIDFMTTADLDALDVAKTMAVQKQIDKIDVKNLTEETAIALNEALADLIRIILPDIPAERLAGLKTGQRLMIVDFWNKNNKIEPATEKNGRGRAD